MTAEWVRRNQILVKVWKILPFTNTFYDDTVNTYPFLGYGTVNVVYSFGFWL